MDIQRAKDLIRSLADGVDPFTGEILPADSICNKAEIVRAFYCVLDTLTHTEGPEQKKRAALQLCSIPYEDRQKFDYSFSPIQVSEITRRFNALINEPTIRKITPMKITSWLVKAGMLEIVEMEDGSKGKLPSDRGRQLGLTTEKRVHDDRSYTVTLYNQNAQKFIVEHLDQIMGAENQAAPGAEFQGTPWTQKQTEYLIDSYKKEVPINQIATTLKRTPEGVRKRLKRLGLL